MELSVNMHYAYVTEVDYFAGNRLLLCVVE